MHLTALPTTFLLLLLLPLLASVTAAAAAPDDEGRTTSQSQTSTSTLTITRTLYTITATATSVLALTIQTDGTTLLTYPDIQKPTGTDSLGDILLATPLPSIISSSSISSSFPQGTGGTGVLAPSITATGAPIAKFTGAATRGRPHVLGLAVAVAIGLAAGLIAWNRSPPPCRQLPGIGSHWGRLNERTKVSWWRWWELVSILFFVFFGLFFFFLFFFFQKSAIIF